MNTYYTHAITIEQNQLAHIAAAYRAAGLTPPSRAVGILAAAEAEPSAASVAADLAREALTATDPDAFHADAIQRIARAQAGDALKAALASAIRAAQKAAMPDMLAQAAADLRPAVTRNVKALTAAAKALPPGKHPLSLDAVVDTDTTREMKAAHTALTFLASIAAIYVIEPTDGNTPPALNKHLAILDIPPCTVELRPRGLGVSPEPLNAAQLSTTLAVRQLTKDIAEDPDTALVRVSRGDYDGVRISLATPDELTERKARAHAAHTRRTVDAHAPMAVMR